MRTLSLATLLLLLGACDSAPVEDDLGTFEATFTGSVDARLDGRAVFSTFVDPLGGSARTVTMIPDGASGMQSLGIVGLDGVLEGTGTYTLGPDGALGLTYIDLGASIQLVATSGTLRVTTFEADRIKGSFEADLAEGVVPDGGGSARVVGSFAAAPLPGR